MKGLSTAWVVVVDNEPNEGIAIVSALSKYGVGTSYFTGDPEELPKRRLNGIRLLVLDMNLLTADTGSLENTLSPLVNVVDKLIAKDSKPFILLAWTQHPDYVEVFTKMLDQVRPDLKPCFTTTFKKEDYKIADGEDRFDSEKIRNNLWKQSKSWFPFDLLMEWEQRVHDATSETFSSVTFTSGKSENEWSLGTSRILSALAIASGGKQTGLWEDAVECLFKTLNIIQEDCLESLPMKGNCTSQSIKLQDTINKGGDALTLTGRQRNELNRILSMAQVRKTAHGPRPGNIYLEKGWQDDAFPIGPKGITKAILVTEMLGRPGNLSDTQWQKKIYSFGCVPVVVEITPPCDYSQNNSSQCRVVVGLLVPERHSDNKNMKTRASFLKSIGPLHLSKSNQCPISGEYFLLLNSRYILGIPTTRMADNMEAYRLRKHVLSDVQHWFASQAARPGYVSVDTL
jgi:hypothetical protein